MKYPQSKIILERIKKAEEILINCHENPDPDSVGSALSLYQIINKMGKGVKIVCPTEIPQTLAFLPHFEKIEVVDFTRFDFSAFDIFIALDSSSWDMVTGSKEIAPPKISTIAIDHHKTNEGYGEVNLIDAKIGSSAELLYFVFKDWGEKADEDVAICLLTGIIGDTGVFRNQAATSQTFRITAELMDKGANKDRIIFEVYESLPLGTVKLWGEFIKRMEVDAESKFVWSAVPWEEVRRYQSDEVREVKSNAASLFFRNIKDTDFGIVMLEAEKGRLAVSLRARTNVDISELAKRLGGGGHKKAAGATVEGLSFQDAVNKVLQAAREFAKDGKG